MATLTPPQIFSLAKQAGFKDPVTATAVALAESSGQVGITNRQGSGAAGLWQILPSAHPQYSVPRLLGDPAYNAHAALAISNGGTNWNPWQTFTNGAYRQYLPVAQRVAASGGAPSAASSTSQTGSWASALAGSTVASPKYTKAAKAVTAGTWASALSGSTTAPARAQTAPQLRPTRGAGSWADALGGASTSQSSFASAGLTTPATASGGYPLATRGNVIGVPYKGTHTLYGNWESDNAVDLAVPVGTPVVALSDGTIGQQIGPLQTGGDPHLEGLRLHLVTPGNEFYYAHLSKIVVKPGERVRAGQVLGYSGEANGVAHLHLGEKNGNPLRIAG